MKTKFVLCALLLCITSTIAVGQQVSVNYDHNASFSQYHTYAWASNNANQIQNSILAQVAQQDINAAMQGKGFQLVQENQNPDHAPRCQRRVKATDLLERLGHARDWRGNGWNHPQQNVEGTLIVDLHAVKTQSLIWRGIAQDTLSNNGDKNQKAVGNAVTKMFKQWPKS